jgi:predicted sulfurtransferase
MKNSETKRIGEIPIDDRNKIVISIGAFDGAAFVDIRTFWRTIAIETWKPSKKGARIYDLKRFRKLIDRAFEKIGSDES